jgi:tRNA threonylcarbamoyl adenosine modification protein YeaZ
MPIGLGLDTTSAVLTLALEEIDGLHRYRSWHLDREMSSQLHPLLRDFIKPYQWKDLAWIVVLKGPGSFTGTRMGVVTARTLAQQLQLPLFGLSNLAIAVWMEAHRQNIQECWTVAVSQPGQRGYCYGAIYDVHLKTGILIARQADQLFAIDDWNQLIQNTEQPLDVCLKHDSPQTTDFNQLAQAMLNLGRTAWQQGTSPSWEKVLPYYG